MQKEEKEMVFIDTGDFDTEVVNWTILLGVLGTLGSAIYHICTSIQ